MKQRSGFNLFNLLAVLFAIVALLVVGALVAFFLAPDLFGDIALGGLLGQDSASQPVPTSAVVAAVPSVTSTSTPSSLLATWTPLAAAASPTTAPSSTRGPTLTPSLIPTFPTKTPTPTNTPTATNTPTETPIGPTPTSSPTRSPFPFTKTDTSPFYLQNYANSAGCNWLGIAGEVLDLNRNPVPPGQYRVHV